MDGLEGDLAREVRGSANLEKPMYLTDGAEF